MSLPPASTEQAPTKRSAMPSLPRIQLTRPQVLTALLLVALAVFLLWDLDYAPLWNPDEGRYAAAALEMIGGVEGGRDPDRVVAHLNTVPRLNKPPLVYWMIGTFLDWFGPHTWAVRLTPALAAIGVMLIIWRLAGAMFSPAAGVLSALVWATSAFPYAMGRVGNTDMLLTFSMTLALWGLWGSAECGARNTKCEVEEPLFRVPYLPFIIAGIGFGLAMLSKGPVGVVLPLLIAGLWLAFTWRWRAINWIGVAVMAGVMLLIALPWYIAISMREPGFLSNFLLGENLARFSGSEDFHDPTPFWYYIPVLILGLLPWTPLLIPALVRLANAGKSGQTPLLRRARSFLWLWAALIFLIFSISDTKLISYILPAFPAFAMLIGEALGSFRKSRNKNAVPVENDEEPIPFAETGWSGGWRSLIGFLTLLINLVLAGAAAVYLLNDRTMDQDLGTVYLIIAGLLLFFHVLAVAGALSLGNRKSLAAVQGLTSIALFLLLMRIAHTISYHEDASAMIRELKPYVEEGARFVQYESFDPSAIFYLQRPVTYIGYENTSGLDSADMDKSPYFQPDRPGLLIELLERPQPIYILIRRKHFDPIQKELPRMRGFVVGRNNDYIVWSNRRDAQDFFMHVAPLKLD